MNNANVSIRIVTDAEKNTWDSVVHHPLQSWSWGDFRSRMGIEVIRLGEYDNKHLKNGWQITFHKIPGLPFTVGYIPRSPIPDTTIIDAIKSIGKEKNTIFIQFEPIALDTHENTQLVPIALTPSHHPLFSKYTFLYDISKSETELLKAMHPKTRYNIRVAQKNGVTIQEDNSEKAFTSYLSLIHETTTRQKFYAHNDTYQRTMWDTMHKSNIAHLFTATHNGSILAAWILFAWNDTVYYPYGATSRENRQLMAPNLMLWETALWAKKHGYKTYDLWGALGPTPDMNDPWYGFHRFKQGYSPTLTTFIGSYDLIIHPLGYKTYCFMDTLRWKLLSLKSRIM